MNWKMLAAVIFLTGMLLAGDYLIKFSVRSSHVVLFLFLAGLFWVASIPGWYWTLLEKNMSLIGMLFSVLSLIGTASIGILVFGERLSGVEWLGMALGLAATILLAGKL